MLTTGRDGWLHLWNSYYARNTWGAERLDQGDFGSDPSVVYKGTHTHTHAHTHTHTHSLCPWIKNLNHRQQFYINPHNLIGLGENVVWKVKRGGNSSWELRNRNVVVVRGVPVLSLTSHFAFPWGRDVLMSRSVSVWPSTRVRSQLILLRL